MTSRLLSLAVTVDQHDCGDYYWQILESHDHLAEFELLVEGARPHATYIDALRDGCEALAALCEDPLVGPTQEEVDTISSIDEHWPNAARGPFTASSS
jgi:hypothetical protein